MLALVVRGSGYIGRHLQGSLSKSQTILGAYFKHPTNFPGNQVFLDIRDTDFVESLFRDSKLDIVFHLAYDPQELEGSETSA